MYRYAYVAIGVLAAGMFCSTAAAAVLVQDDFNQSARQGQALAGSTTSDGNYQWSVANGGTAGPMVENNQLDFGTTQSNGGGTAYINADSTTNPELLQPNFSLSFDYIYGANFADNNGLRVNYRMTTSKQAVSNGGAQDGYVLRITKTDADTYSVRIDTDDAAILNPIDETFTGFEWGTPLAVRIEVDGTSQKIFFNNESTARIDITDSSFLTTGGWNFQSSASNSRPRSIDNVVFSSVPEPSAMLPVLGGLALAFGGRRGRRRAQGAKSCSARN